MNDFTKYFLYVPGIIIFLLGSARVKDFFVLKKAGGYLEAVVISCEHVVKKDSKGREQFNFYNVLVEFTNPDTRHRERHAIKSPTEYQVSQQVRIFRSGPSAAPMLSENKTESPFHPAVVMVSGALLILLALYQIKGEVITAIRCLAAVFLIAGINLVVSYFLTKKRKLTPVKAIITDVYKRQISKETKVIKGNKFAYYPVVSYTVEGRDCLRRCTVNSSLEKTYKVGEAMELYYDAANKQILENKEKLSHLIIGAALAVLGIVTLVL